MNLDDSAEIPRDSTVPELTDASASNGFYIFARFYARPGSEAAVAAAIRDVLAPTRKEAGCIRADAFRSIRDARLFYIHSRWRDEGAFEFHRTLPHTLRFIERVGTLIDHDLDVARTMLMD
jgi:quinol monooxygenase YgiN